MSLPIYWDRLDTPLPDKPYRDVLSPADQTLKQKEKGSWKQLSHQEKIACNQPSSIQPSSIIHPAIIHRSLTSFSPFSISPLPLPPPVYSLMFNQTYPEMKQPTGEWKTVLGGMFIFLGLTGLVVLWQRYYGEASPK